MSVSPANARLCTKVVTDFILDYHSSFQLFSAVLIFLLLFSSRKKVNEGQIKKLINTLSKRKIIQHNNKINKNYLSQIYIKKDFTYNTASADLRKKAVKKFEWQSLRNEIDVTNL